jgi:staphylococcal nuclease domain-containing protein 1
MFEARVKSVLSGDTLILSHVTNLAQERTLSLAYVSAPRLRREGDEVCLFFLFSLILFCSILFYLSYFVDLFISCFHLYFLRFVDSCSC